MAEVSENAAIFIATSFQAMEELSLEFLLIPDSNLMIALVFLALSGRKPRCHYYKVKERRGTKRVL